MVELNPFDDFIVKEPRHRESAVAGLNEKPLRTLLARAEQLLQGGPPRKVKPAGQAVLVTSAQPGFGKSHLIGRLFRELHGRATIVYVRPFQNSGLAFQSLLAAVVKEMHFPDRTDWESWKPTDPTQFDILAFSILGHLVADLAERHGDQQIDQMTFLRQNAAEAFGYGVRGRGWADWMYDSFAQNRNGYEQALLRRGVELHSPEWLRVLFSYAFSYPDRVVRQACLDWIAGQTLSAEQAALIGLRPGEVSDVELSADVVNNNCRQRLIDLCQLAVFYRPFVFCFDQTEAYGHASALARTFGMLISTLVNEAANHLTLVTSNQDPWLKTIAIYFERADTERFDHPPVSLEGLTRVHGEELIRLRLADANASPEMSTAMLDSDWLSRIFITDRAKISTRSFLQKCKTRWEELHQRTIPSESLEDLYDSRRMNLLAEPKRLLYDADLLQWLVKTCAAGLEHLKIEPDRSGHFAVQWQRGEGTVLFGFESGSNSKRWEAIAQHSRERCQSRPASKVVFFRDAQQPVIPGADWPSAQAIKDAFAQCLELIILSPEDCAELYAGYDLHAAALSGDVPPFSASEVLDFLRDRFAPWWERFLAPIAAAPAEPAPKPEVNEDDKLADEVRAIVAAQKFLGLDELIKHLGRPVSKEDVLKACGYSAEIRVHAHSQMTVLQWQAN